MRGTAGLASAVDSGGSKEGREEMESSPVYHVWDFASLV